MHLSCIQSTQHLGLLLTKLRYHRFPSQELLLQHINRSIQINIEHVDNVPATCDKKRPATLKNLGVNLPSNGRC